MQTKFTRDAFNFSRYTYFAITIILFVVFQADLCNLWAGEKYGKALSLSKTIELSLEHNIKNIDHEVLPSEDVIFSAKRYYYQIQTQVEQLETAEEVRDHFQKAINKSEKIFEDEEGDVSQFDITRLKLGLSDTLNDIIGLKYSIKIAKLELGKLIGKKIEYDHDIPNKDIIPVSFPYDSFEKYLEEKKVSQLSKILESKANVASSKTSVRASLKLYEGARLTLHKAFIAVKEADAKVMLGKKNRKISRALLVAEVANYDFGIGDSQELFEALIVYTRVLSSYLDSIYNLNVAVAELEKLTNAI